MRALIVTVVALPVLALSAPLEAASGTNADVRCLLVSNLYGNNADDAKAKDVANSAKLFFGGRVSGLSGAELEAAMLIERDKIKPDNASAAMTDCAREMERALKAIQAVGQKLATPRSTRPA